MGMTKQTDHPDTAYGTLYVVSTPIGNLEDITLRALKILKGVDMIAAESVRHTRNLCRHYGIHTRIVRYNQHNQGVKGTELIEKLKNGKDIALVTNAGTPGVSDPGVLLAAQAQNEEIRISPIPGPSSVTAALSVSGLRSDRFLFMGFLSNRATKRKKELDSLAFETRTLVFLEAPHRIRPMLKDLKTVFGDRRVVLAREMTKVFEEILVGTADEILARIEADGFRGEYTVVVAGHEECGEKQVVPVEVTRKIRRFLKTGNLSTKDIAKKISLDEGVSYRAVYKICLDLKQDRCS